MLRRKSLQQTSFWGAISLVAGVCCGLTVAHAEHKAKPGEPDWTSRWESVSQLREILEGVPTGRKILNKANEKDPEFQKKVAFGRASFTESTLVRSYSLLNGKEEVNYRHEITLNKNHALHEAVLDFAHELVHLSEKTMLDPYGAVFEKEAFIRHGIEGPGGELEAFLRECQVAKELRETYSRFPTHPLCAPFERQGKAISREAVRRAYYQIGKSWNQTSPLLLETIPELSPDAPVFTSSYAKRPYPLALADEYFETRKAACANNKRKYRLIASQAEGRGRVLAQESILTRERYRLKQYDRLFCGGEEGRSRQPVSARRGPAALP